MARARARTHVIVAIERQAHFVDFANLLDDIILHPKGLGKGKSMHILRRPVIARVEHHLVAALSMVERVLLRAVDEVEAVRVLLVKALHRESAPSWWCDVRARPRGKLVRPNAQ